MQLTQIIEEAGIQNIQIRMKKGGKHDAIQ